MFVFLLSKLDALSMRKEHCNYQLHKTFDPWKYMVFYSRQWHKLFKIIFSPHINNQCQHIIYTYHSSTMITNIALQNSQQGNVFTHQGHTIDFTYNKQLKGIGKSSGKTLLGTHGLNIGFSFGM